MNHPRVPLLLLLLLLLPAGRHPAFADAAADFERSIRPLLQKHCLTCHSEKKQKGDLDLERFTTVAHIKTEPMIWEGVLEQSQTGEMPPKKEPQLSLEHNTALT